MDWFESVPKVELHVHLEGAIPVEALFTLVEKYGGDPTVPSLEALRERFRYRDFPHFIRTWVWKNGFLREYEDFTFLAEAVARDLARQRVRYAEVFYSPPDFVRHGLSLEPLTLAVRRGLARVPEVEIALVADLVRDYGPDRGDETLTRLVDVAKECGVVGIGIGGSEQAFPPEPWAAVYERARKLGFRTSAHAGEAAGAASVWGALRALRVDRVGHGTRAFEDPALVDHLAEHQVPIELCPMSNVRTGVVPSLSAHPVRSWLERGLRLSINTDDPAMFNTSLAGEYRALAEVHGLTRDALRGLILSGIEASWLDDDRREALKEAFVRDPAWGD